MENNLINPDMSNEPNNEGGFAPFGKSKYFHDIQKVDFIDALVEKSREAIEKSNEAKGEKCKHGKESFCSNCTKTVIVPNPPFTPQNKESILNEWHKICPAILNQEFIKETGQSIADWFLSRTIPRESLKEEVEALRLRPDKDFPEPLDHEEIAFNLALDKAISLISKHE